MIKKDAKIKKRFGRFYKIILSIIILLLLLLFYFVVLVATGPKSLQIVTDKITQEVQKEFGSESSIQDSYVTFTAYGTLRVTVDNLNIYNTAQNQENKEFFTIPKIEAEFSLIDLLFLNFQPQKVRVSKALIVINDIKNLQSSKEDVMSSEAQIATVATIFSKMRSGENPIEDFEIIDSKIALFNNGKRSDILLKSAKIHAENKASALQISSQNIISFDPHKADVTLDANCSNSLEKGIYCDLFLDNFIPDSIAEIHPNLVQLSNIKSSLDANISVTIKDHALQNLFFKITSQVGSLNFSDLFSSEVQFKNLALEGEYDNLLKTLNISSIKADLFDANNQSGAAQNIDMSLVLAGIGSEEKKSNFHIKLENIANQNLAKYWPVFLKDYDASKWVLENIRDGVIKNAYAKFSLKHNASESQLEDVDAQVIFSDVNLQYDKNFPQIKNISGIANFTKKGMKIDISKGDVLQSKLSNGAVIIENFLAKETILEISGNLVGSFANALRHIDNGEEFSNFVEKNFLGAAETKFQVDLNLSDTKFSLKSVALDINSSVRNLKSDYVVGSTDIKVKKDFKNSNFTINANLKDAEIIAKNFDITKKSGIAGSINLDLAIKDDNALQFRNVVLSKEENGAKINADFTLYASPFFFKDAKIVNQNFGLNNFTASFSQDIKSQKNRIALKGKRFNLGGLISNKALNQGKSGANSGVDKLNNFSADINVARIDLLQNKYLRNFSLSASCVNGFCYRGAVAANYNGKDIIDIKVSKGDKENSSLISGKISQLGYLAEGFGIYNLVAGGNAKIKVANTSQKNKAVFEGKIEVDEDITFYENNAVKKLSKDNLFAKIKDKIFSSEKTIFDFVKLEFELKEDVFTIESLVANNYKIGITGKGFVNLQDGTYNLRGMIVPGFLINNLFGIGNIPLIGGVISGLLTGGEGGGLFGLKYNYVKNKGDKEGNFTTNKVTAFVPSTLQNLFD